MACEQCTRKKHREETEYKDSYIINWLNSTNDENTGILEKNINNVNFEFFITYFLL